MPVPQVLADLPYAQYLEPFQGELTHQGDYTEVLFADLELVDVDAGNVRIRESAFTGVTFTDGRLVRARLSDVWFNRTRWVGTSLAELDCLDGTVLDSFFGAVEAYAATLRRVTFQECKIDTLNLRGSTLQDVVFDRCELAEVDLSDATVTGVTFPGSALRRLRLDNANLTKVDLRGAAELDVASGCAGLAGAVIDSRQLLQLAPALAQTLGIVVEDG